ncbi:MAG: acyl-CoA dehydrogenase family protein, partial [Alphaproteobacteria bacterium]|nr:acyl-CoA dehydrogenase family protein [Alphaproteobacteria bacterium]
MTGPFRFAPTVLPPEAEELRAEVRRFLAETRDAGLWAPGGDFATHWSEPFSRAVGARGWIGMTWARSFGGGGRTMLERFAVTEELLAAGAPVAAHWIGDRQSGPLLLRYGTREQCRRFLPGIIRGETPFCIGMSEPDAGSDLAALRTRARADGDAYVLTGRK